MVLRQCRKLAVLQLLQMMSSIGQELNISLLQHLSCKFSSDAAQVPQEGTCLLPLLQLRLNCGGVAALDESSS